MNDPPVDRIRSIFVLVAANFAVFAAFWLLFELGMHIGWPNENPLLGPAFAKSKARIANSTYGHTLASNFAGEEFWGARSTKLFTNSLGLRIRQFETCHCVPIANASYSLATVHRRRWRSLRRNLCRPLHCHSSASRRLECCGKLVRSINLLRQNQIPPRDGSSDRQSRCVRRHFRYSG